LNPFTPTRRKFADQEAGQSDFPAHAEIRAEWKPWLASTECSPGVKYAEPFLQKEVGLVEDLTSLSVKVHLRGGYARALLAELYYSMDPALGEGLFRCAHA